MKNGIYIKFARFIKYSISWLAQFVNFKHVLRRKFNNGRVAEWKRDKIEKWDWNNAWICVRQSLNIVSTGCPPLQENNEANQLFFLTISF